MLIRPKLFLTLSLICVAPLLLLSALSFRNQRSYSERLLRAGLQHKVAADSHRLEQLCRERKHELQALARGPLFEYVVVIPNTVRSGKWLPPAQVAASAFGVRDGFEFSNQNYVFDKSSDAVLHLLTHNSAYTAIAAFGSDKSALFLAEPSSSGAGAILRTKDFLLNQIAPDPRVWSAATDTLQCSLVPHTSVGEVLRCSVPIPEAASEKRGALVADLKLDLLFAEVFQGAENSVAPAGGALQAVVLDRSGKIVYHTNDALKYQSAGSALPHFTLVAQKMSAGQSGSEFYQAPDGDTWLAVFAPAEFDLSLGVAINYANALADVRKTSLIGAGLAIVLGLGLALLLSFLYERRAQSIERVSAGVAAIAAGKLDETLVVRSRDDMRPLADSVNLMTEQLREQIRREAETRQFQSFVKLSAMLTHDLKNAIEAVSLIVGNMERHFDDPRFRADTMSGLNGATEKLKALVARLSHPVNTLSGEFKLPQPVDLVPLLRRVLAETGDPVRETHEIAADLPESLFALADAERIEKVIENLILNALEAMAGKRGRLTVAAGVADSRKVFFSVTDTGPGISADFIKRRLFRPFATTKHSGVGLGLYTCREVVQAHGGAIEVESKEGSGATFRVVLASAAIQGAHSSR